MGRLEFSQEHFTWWPPYFLFYEVGENTDDKQTKPQPDRTPQLEDETTHMKEVTYSTVCVKDKKVKQG